MYKLYGRSNTGSAAVEALLSVLDVPFELVSVGKEADGSAPAWYLNVNPRGEVPALQLPNGTVMTESAAIMIYLADVHPEAEMAPALTSADRAQYLRWMVYMAAAPYSTDLRLYYPERYSTDAAHAEHIKAKASADLAQDFDVFADEMGKGPFVLGNQMTAIDIYAAMILNWSDDVEALWAKQPKLKRLYDAVLQNPTVKAVWKRNGMV